LEKEKLQGCLSTTCSFFKGKKMVEDYPQNSNGISTLKIPRHPPGFVRLVTIFPRPKRRYPT